MFVDCASIAPLWCWCCCCSGYNFVVFVGFFLFHFEMQMGNYFILRFPSSIQLVFCTFTTVAWCVWFVVDSAKTKHMQVKQLTGNCMCNKVFAVTCRCVHVSLFVAVKFDSLMCAQISEHNRIVRYQLMSAHTRSHTHTHEKNTCTHSLWKERRKLIHHKERKKESRLVEIADLHTTCLTKQMNTFTLFLLLLLLLNICI